MQKARAARRSVLAYHKCTHTLHRTTRSQAHAHMSQGTKALDRVCLYRAISKKAEICPYVTRSTTRLHRERSHHIQLAFVLLYFSWCEESDKRLYETNTNAANHERENVFELFESQHRMQTVIVKRSKCVPCCTTARKQVNTSMPNTERLTTDLRTFYISSVYITCTDTDTFQPLY